MAAFLHAVKSQGLATRMIIFASPVAIVVLIFLAYLAASPTSNPAELAIGDADLLTSIVGGKPASRVIIESDGMDDSEGLRVAVQPISILQLRGANPNSMSAGPAVGSKSKKSDLSDGRSSQSSKIDGRSRLAGSAAASSETATGSFLPQMNKAALAIRLRLGTEETPAEATYGASGQGLKAKTEKETGAGGKSDGGNAEASAEADAEGDADAEEEAEEVDDEQRGLPAEVLEKERKLARSRKSKSATSRKAVKVTGGNTVDEVGEEDDEAETEEEAEMLNAESDKGSDATAAADKSSEEEDVFRELKLSPEDEAMLRELRETRVEREKAASRVKHKYRKVAFMFLTKGPIPHAKLWERYFKGHEGSYSIYVHPAPGYVFPKNASALFRNNTIRSEAVSWGSPTMIDAERRLIAAALKDPANHNFVLLSESCIPVKSLKFTWRYLLGTDYSFVSSFTTDRYVNTGRHDERMAPLIPIEKWRKASQWFSVTRKHANIIINDIDVHKLFQIYCRGDIQHHECYSDEHYIPTLINLKDPGNLANRTITYVDFPLNSPHPRTFDPFLTRPSLIRYITKPRMYMHRNVVEPDDETPQSSYTLPCAKDGENRTCFLFARKFHPSALPQLLNLPTKILGY
ncbi:unnamed protein product [Closterium sp. NIES-64]|nr:unnamed protein product [Closterium sp. NIES-64]CAI5989479.1 unnamed protein product [Closterium sp. NIES-65]